MVKKMEKYFYGKIFLKSGHSTDRHREGHVCLSTWSLFLRVSLILMRPSFLPGTADLPEGPLLTFLEAQACWRWVLSVSVCLGESLSHFVFERFFSLIKEVSLSWQLFSLSTLKILLLSLLACSISSEKLLSFLHLFLCMLMYPFFGLAGFKIFLFHCFKAIWLCCAFDIVFSCFLYSAYWGFIITIKIRNSLTTVSLNFSVSPLLWGPPLSNIVGCHNSLYSNKEQLASIACQLCSKHFTYYLLFILTRTLWGSHSYLHYRDTRVSEWF